jgi:hypothetical protein
MAVIGNNTAGRALPHIFFGSSESWTPSCTYQAYVYVIGGGGAGGAVGNASSNSYPQAQGGAAGGCAISFLTLTSGVTYTVTVGAGGGFVSHSSGSNAGNNGGNSSLSGSDITTMTANGGDGGAVSTGAISDNDGGTASGGNIANFAGGNGGAVADTNNFTSSGGSVGLWKTGNSADDATYINGISKQGALLNYPQGTMPTVTQISIGTVTRSHQLKGLATLAPFPFIENSSPTPTGVAGTGFTSTYMGFFNPQHQAGSFNWSVLAQENAYRYAASGSPFCGGGSMTNAAGHAYGGTGALGGGGGSALGVSSNQYGYSGAGGDGGVIILPIAMG